MPPDNPQNPDPGNLDNVEPAAETRKFARMCRDMYVALLKEGFAEAQAMQIIGHTIAASIAGRQK